MMGVTLTVSVLSLTAVGLDRHYAILYPVSSRQHRTLRKTSLVIAVFWLFGLVISSPAFVIARKIDIVDMEVCLNYWRAPWRHHTYTVSSCLASFWDNFLIFRTLRKTSLVIAVFWLFGLVISSPAFVIARKIDIVDMEVCLNYWRAPWRHQTYAVLMFIFFYVIPQAILSVCYFRIAKRLWFTMRLHEKPNGKSLQTLKTRRRVVKMVIVVTACFAVCWLPVHLVELYTAYGTAFGSPFYDIKVLAPLVPHFFIATNPIIYCFMSKTFRMSFKAVFPCTAAQSSAGMSLDEHDTCSAINRKLSSKKRSALAKSGSECSLDATNIEFTDRVVSVDKAVNTSPKPDKKVEEKKPNTPDNNDEEETNARTYVNSYILIDDLELETSQV